MEDGVSVTGKVKKNDVVNIKIGKMLLKKLMGDIERKKGKK